MAIRDLWSDLMSGIGGLANKIGIRGDAPYHVAPEIDPSFKPKAEPSMYEKLGDMSYWKEVPVSYGEQQYMPDDYNMVENRSPQSIVSNLMESVKMAYQNPPNPLEGVLGSNSYTWEAPQEKKDADRMAFEEEVARLAQERGYGNLINSYNMASGSEDLVTNFPDKSPFPQELIPAVMEASATYNIDPQILISLIANESGGAGYDIGPDSLGASGERSIAQIIPEYHYNRFGFQNPQEYDEFIRNAPRETAIEHAARIYADYMSYFGDPYEALSAYNAGYNTEAGRPYANAAYNRIGYEIPQY